MRVRGKRRLDSVTLLGEEQRNWGLVFPNVLQQHSHFFSLPKKLPAEGFKATSLSAKPNSFFLPPSLELGTKETFPPSLSLSLLLPFRISSPSKVCFPLPPLVLPHFQSSYSPFCRKKETFLGFEGWCAREGKRRGKTVFGLGGETRVVVVCFPLSPQEIGEKEGEGRNTAKEGKRGEEGDEEEGRILPLVPPSLSISPKWTVKSRSKNVPAALSEKRGENVSETEKGGKVRTFCKKRDRERKTPLSSHFCPPKNISCQGVTNPPFPYSSCLFSSEKVDDHYTPAHTRLAAVAQ